MPDKLTPTEKSPAMDAFLKNVLGFDRHAAIASLTCGSCKGSVVPEALSEIDLREYRISGWCPSCSAKNFGSD